jgi:hypothetical protein
MPYIGHRYIFVCRGREDMGRLSRSRLKALGASFILNFSVPKEGCHIVDASDEAAIIITSEVIEKR